MGSLKKRGRRLGAAGSYPSSSTNVSWCESLSLNRLRLKERRPVGGTGRLFIRSAWGKSGAVGERAGIPRETVVLSASQATMDDREPSKVGSETTQIHPWRSALAETLPCLGGLGPLTAEEPIRLLNHGSAGESGITAYFKGGAHIR